jgi:nucleotidyltransferase/DNA polymerase involved in DNA repair
MGGKIRHVALVVPGRMLQLVEAAHPELRGTPWVLASQEGTGAVVDDCSDAARALAIAPFMRLSELRLRFPKVAVRHPDARALSNFRKALASLCQARTSMWSLGADGASLDLSGASLRFDGDWSLWAQRLRTELEQTTGVYRVNLVATSVRGASEALARAGAGATGMELCQPGEEMARLDPVSLDAIPWISRNRLEKLRFFGIRDLGDVRRKPRSFIKLQVGNDGDRLAALAMGVDPDPAGRRQALCQENFATDSAYVLDLACV